MLRLLDFKMFINVKHFYMSQLHDGDEKKDPENGEKDDITYADLDSNALTSGMTEFVF